MPERTGQAFMSGGGVRMASMSMGMNVTEACLAAGAAVEGPVAIAGRGQTGAIG
jgi:hypothetical protein